LRKADIDVKIVSGDSPLTTIHCGKECSMIPFSGSVLLIDCIEELVLHSIQGMQV
jgi:magnesium-transporting ATPase (P-type)